MACRGSQTALIQLPDGARGAGSGTRAAHEQRVQQSLRNLGATASQGLQRSAQAQQQQARSAAEIQQASAAVRRATSRQDIDRALQSAKQALDQARRAGGDKSDLLKLERSFEALTAEAERVADGLHQQERGVIAQQVPILTQPDVLDRRLLGTSRRQAPRSVAGANSGPVDKDRRDSETELWRSLEMRGQAARSRIEQNALDVAAWVAGYRAATSGNREIVETTDKGFQYVYDATLRPSEAEVGNRLVAIHGRSGEPLGDRRVYEFKSRIDGHPRQAGTDRGHGVPHSAGGGADINLFPQDTKLNRGHSEPGKAWRGIESHLAMYPETPFFLHFEYSDLTDHPSQVEYGIQLTDGGWLIQRFENPKPTQ